MHILHRIHEDKNKSLNKFSKYLLPKANKNVFFMIVFAKFYFLSALFIIFYEKSFLVGKSYFQCEIYDYNFCYTYFMLLFYYIIA